VNEPSAAIGSARGTVNVTGIASSKVEKGIGRVVIETETATENGTEKENGTASDDETESENWTEIRDAKGAGRVTGILAWVSESSSVRGIGREATSVKVSAIALCRIGRDLGLLQVVPRRQQSRPR